MKQQPTLRTERLILRPFQSSDASAVQQLAGAYEVALNTATVPHPYPDGAAEEWIASQPELFEKDELHNFAMVYGEHLIGSIGLIPKGNGIVEIGYWAGVPFWGRGYASEAGRELVRYGFEECGARRIFAGHFGRNPASGRVLQKLGMQYEGTLRQHMYKWGEYLDVVFYGLLRDEWLSSATLSTPDGAGDDRNSAGR
jgi:[ribosomal protein S5]-alanine N-acetyltransferase